MTLWSYARIEDTLFRGRLGYEYRASPVWESETLTVVCKDYTSGATVYEIYSGTDGERLFGQLDANSAKRIFNRLNTEGVTLK